jgi:hypothetical protein
VKHALRDSTSHSDVAARRTVTPPLAIVAAAGAAAPAVGWGWDVAAHARASNGGPVSWALIYLGLVVAATALLASHRSRGPGPTG